ncbi:hypothetical protein BH23ACT6_BH23ACT6_26800 [soil metagenome]
MSEPKEPLDSYERSVLASWTDTHKKSTLVLLVLLAVRDRARWSGELTEFIDEVSNGQLRVDAQSLHRALRRLDKLNVITHNAQSVPKTGAKRKAYELTASGHRILETYCATTLSYLEHPAVKEMLQGPPEPQHSGIDRP